MNDEDDSPLGNYIRDRRKFDAFYRAINATYEAYLAQLAAHHDSPERTAPWTAFIEKNGIQVAGDIEKKR